MTDETTSNISQIQNSGPVRLVEGPVVYVPHEELSLVDAALVLVRRWMWVVLGIACGLGLSAWWISKSPVRYESRGVVRIGRSRASFPIKPTKEQQDMLLEPVSVASMRIREEYSAASALSQQYGAAAVTNTVFDREADELLTLFARAGDPDSAQKFLDAVMLDFVQQHKQLFADERAVMEGRLKGIGLERDRIRKELQSLETATGPTGKSDTEAALTALRQLTRAQLLQQEITLEQEAVRLQRDSIDLQSQPTVRISSATRASSPVEPRTTFLLMLGSVIGIVLGCGLAFFVEFAIQVRRRLSH
ncbi:MAG: chain length determinant family protein [Planctomycetaceae bacterium]|nr:chain length determinant family protein [Planctomycetaceae bacterium]